MHAVINCAAVGFVRGNLLQCWTVGHTMLSSRPQYLSGNSPAATFNDAAVSEPLPGESRM